MVKCLKFKEILNIIDISFSKAVIAKTLSEFFVENVYERRNIRIRLQKSELRNHPFMYLVRFLLFCEKFKISSNLLRIMYVDSVGNLQYNFIRKRFPQFTASIYFISGCDLHTIPAISIMNEVYTILIIDNSIFAKGFMTENCDLEIRLVISDEDR